MEILSGVLKLLLCFCCFYVKSWSLCVEKGNCDVRHSQRSVILPFFVVKTSIYQQCCNLCASSEKCTSVNYDVTTRQCALLSDLPQEKDLANSESSIYGSFVKKKGKPPKNICRTRPCKAHEICVMTSSGDAHICLGGTVCTSPPVIDRMTSSLDFVTLTSGQATYACDSGYIADNSSGLSLCSDTTGWNSPSLVCKGIDCGNPNIRVNLNMTSVTSTLYLDHVIYTCVVGYSQIDGDGTSLCQQNGLWSTPSIKCQVVNCGTPGDVDNMEKGLVSSTVFRSQVTFTCSSGFDSDGGNGTSTCQADGTWSSPVLICTRKDCLSPPSKENMTVSVTSTLYESEAVYSCDVGYKVMSGSGKSVCQADGSWEVPSLTCEIVYCGFPPNVTNMTLVSVSPMTYGSNALYACAVGYSQNGGDGRSTCQANATWSQPSMECQIVDCGEPPVYTNYELASVPSTIYQSTAVYRCLLGYASPDNAQSICQDTGQWSTFSLVCRGYISHGISTVTTTNLECVTRLSKAGTTVSVPCETDEVLTGCSTLTVDNTTQSRGQLIAQNSCYSYGTGAVQAVGRCCKQQGLKCEHIRQASQTSCVKDFQLLDCSCAAVLNYRHCCTDHVNQTCEPVTVNAPNNHNSYYLSLCCTSPGLSCHTKTLSSDGSLSRNLSLHCDAGEVMTGCSGYNIDTNIQGAVVQDIGGVDTCIVMPGMSNITTITGYAHCCTSP